MIDRREITDEGGRAALIGSASWSSKMPRTSSSLFLGVTADEESGGWPRVWFGAADDGPGDPEVGSIANTEDKNENTRKIRNYSSFGLSWH